MEAEKQEEVPRLKFTALHDLKSFPELKDIEVDCLAEKEGLQPDADAFGNYFYLMVNRLNRCEDNKRVVFLGVKSMSSLRSISFGEQIKIGETVFYFLAIYSSLDTAKNGPMTILVLPSEPYQFGSSMNIFSTMAFQYSSDVLKFETTGPVLKNVTKRLDPREAGDLYAKLIEFFVTAGSTAPPIGKASARQAIVAQQEATRTHRPGDFLVTIKLEEERKLANSAAKKADKVAKRKAEIELEINSVKKKRASKATVKQLQFLTTVAGAPIKQNVKDEATRDKAIASILDEQEQQRNLLKQVQARQSATEKEFAEHKDFVKRMAEGQSHCQGVMAALGSSMTELVSLVTESNKKVTSEIAQEKFETSAKLKGFEIEIQSNAEKLKDDMKIVVDHSKCISSSIKAYVDQQLADHHQQQFEQHEHQLELIGAHKQGPGRPKANNANRQFFASMYGNRPFTYNMM
jgi:antitoxin component HigA of HigAB toxin-antitoxin module